VGLTPMVAINGREALEIIEARMESDAPPFDLICMDIHMPVMDGIEAAAKISALGIGSPIIAMTANMNGFADKPFAGVGMESSVVKPLNPQEFWRVLVKYLA